MKREAPVKLVSSLEGGGDFQPGPPRAERIPRGGAAPSQACSMWGASSTSVAASAFCVATDNMFHHLFSNANAVDFLSLGATS